MYKLFLIAAAMGCLLSVVVAICEPDCTGKNPGDKIEDPMNCTKYYICMEGEIPSDVSLPCSPGNVFDPNDEKCAPGDTCVASCVPPVCHLTCTKQVDLISDPNDCSIYRICLAGQVVDSKRCESDAPYFNGEFCVKDESQCCSDLCSPYCHMDVVQIPDPKNCTAFYICEALGVPSEDHHFSCKDNEVFDITLGRCTANAQCRPLCDDGTDPPESSTTTTTTTTTNSNECKDSMICSDVGFFPQCTTCQPGYFECTGPGQQGILHTCPDGDVFNTNPDVPYCISPEACPFDP